MSYDFRCYDLASTFLEDVENIDYEKACHELAQLIQTTIEDWIEYGQPAALTESETLNSSSIMTETPVENMHLTRSVWCGSCRWHGITGELLAKDKLRCPKCHSDWIEYPVVCTAPRMQ